MNTKLKPFDPIVPPADDYRGPAHGLSSEHGDSWRSAMVKINQGFEHIYAMFNAAGTPPLGDDAAEMATAEDVKSLREEIAALQMRFDDFLGAPAAVGITGAASGSPAPEGDTGGDPNVKPADDGSFKAPGAGSD